MILVPSRPLLEPCLSLPLLRFCLQADLEAPQAHEKSIFRRRKAKGPNPLSARVSKKRTNSAASATAGRAANSKAGAGESGNGGDRKHRARRKRRTYASADPFT